jgi:hypothetical protein
VIDKRSDWKTIIHDGKEMRVKKGTRLWVNQNYAFTLHEEIFIRLPEPFTLRDFFELELKFDPLPIEDRTFH